jgi:hypothetical protein
MPGLGWASPRKTTRAHFKAMCGVAQSSGVNGDPRKARSLNELAEHLGHADPAFTARTYVELMRDASKRRRLTISEVIQGGSVSPVVDPESATRGKRSSANSLGIEEARARTRTGTASLRALIRCRRRSLGVAPGRMNPTTRRRPDGDPRPRPAEAWTPRRPPQMSGARTHRAVRRRPRTHRSHAANDANVGPATATRSRSVTQASRSPARRRSGYTNNGANHPEIFEEHPDVQLPRLDACDAQHASVTNLRVDAKAGRIPRARGTPICPDGDRNRLDFHDIAARGLAQLHR